VDIGVQFSSYDVILRLGRFETPFISGQAQQERNPFNASTRALDVDRYQFVQSSYPKETQQIHGKLEDYS
jgi:hypothetical protein